MEPRAKRAPKLRKIDIRVPVLQERGVGWDTPLFDAVDRALLRAIDGKSTVHTLAVAAGRSDEEVARSLSKLERLRVITFAEATRKPLGAPPTRLKSGMRPAMKTLTDPMEGADATPGEPENDREHADRESHDRPTVVPPASEPEVEVARDVDALLEEVGGGDEDGGRLTLVGIGPRAAAR